MTLEDIIVLQKEYMLTGVTKDVNYRKENLERLLESINEHESAIYDAIYEDMGRSEMETFLTEVSFVKNELNIAINNIEKWVKPEKIKRPFSLLAPRSYICKEPYGSVLIISPWCNPVSLSLVPLIGAIAAGNCAVVRCSRKCENIARVLASIINTTFDKRYVYAIEDPLPYNEIINQNYDYIFFTGSERVGRNIIRAAATNITPYTLELGGKNPCIIGPEADIDLAAREIMYGKIINAGQTCVAPDYVVVSNDIKTEFVRKLRGYADDMVGDAFSNSNYPRINNLHNFMRLTRCISNEKEVIGGKHNDKQRKIEPTILPSASFDSDIMKEEIFGPILPVIGFNDIEEAIMEIKRRLKPLTCYIFSKDRDFVDDVIEDISFGNCCVNGCISQFLDPYLPFGGVGNSGHGRYHGQSTFNTFSNTKSVIVENVKIGSNYKYPPFSKEKLEKIKK